MAASYLIYLLTSSMSRPSHMPRYSEKFRRVPLVTYRVTLDDVKLFDSQDYVLCMGAVTAWRKNNPREDKKRMAIRILI